MICSCMYDMQLYYDMQITYTPLPSNNSLSLPAKSGVAIGEAAEPLSAPVGTAPSRGAHTL